MKLHFEKKARVRFFMVISVGMFIALGWPQVNAVAWTSSRGIAAQSKQVELKADPKKVPNELDGVGVKEHLGETLDTEHLEFLDSVDGQKHKLKEYFVSGKPLLINLVYFECPMLCTMVLNGVKDGLKQLDWSVGKEFNVLTISINPNDTPALAKAKRENYLKSYSEDQNPNSQKRNPQNGEAGWHFLTGSEDQIKKLASELGFEYKYDTIQKEFAHPAVTFVLTPAGEISRYLYGIVYHPKDLRLALLEASQGKIGNVFDRILMFCYHYEPSLRGYTLQAVRVMQAGGVATVMILGGFLTLFWVKQAKQTRLTRQRKGRLT